MRKREIKDDLCTQAHQHWRREGLKVPKKQPKRARLWLNDGSCIRLRPERPNHVWSYDFMQDRTEDGRRFRMLTVIDEYTRRCLAIVVAPTTYSTASLSCSSRTGHQSTFARTMGQSSSLATSASGWVELA